MTANAPGLFDRPATAPTLPDATIEALQEIPIEGKRAWVRSLLLATLTGTRNLEAVRESLSHERMPADLITRITGPMQEEHP